MTSSVYSKYTALFSQGCALRKSIECNTYLIEIWNIIVIKMAYCINAKGVEKLIVKEAKDCRLTSKPKTICTEAPLSRVVKYAWDTKYESQALNTAITAK